MSDAAANVGLVLGAMVVAAAVSAALIVLSWPWLRSYALARPNARSSHRIPTPQGGGIAVVVATLAVTWSAIAWAGSLPDEARSRFALITAAALLLALIGAVDDLRNLAAGPRLLLQCVALGGVIAALPENVQIAPVLPWWVERIALLIGGVYFVNLVNFMDGIDWMTCAEIIPVTAALVLIGFLSGLPLLPMLCAGALCGAMLGFAAFNRPVAKLFLGDVGSLPIGLLLGVLLIELGQRGYLPAAVLLPLYYLADATITLSRRIWQREPFWQAHRTHYYQRALDRGFTVLGVVTRVFAVNVALAGLALITVMLPSFLVTGLALAAGTALVAWLLWSLAHGTS